MSFYSSGKWLSSPKMDSRIQSSNVTNKERWLGFFLGPGGVILLNAIIGLALPIWVFVMLNFTACLTRMVC